MGRLVVTEFMTLDGVAQAPGGTGEDTEGGFIHGGWQAPLADAGAGDAIFDQARTMDALLLGRKTYEIFADYWPHAPVDSPFTGLLNGVPKFGASRSLTGLLAWHGASLLVGDVVDAVTVLTDRFDEVQVIGSLDLVQTLLRAGLVDELHLWVYPLLLGSGKRVFAGGTAPTALRLVDSVTWPAGALHLTYRTDGPPTYGEMAPDG